MTSKKNWDDLTPEEKKTGMLAVAIIGSIILVFIIAIVVSVRGNSNGSTVADGTINTQTPSDTSEQNASNNVDKKLAVMNIADEAIASADGGNCYAEYIEPDESAFASVSSMGTAATYYFVESAKQVFADGQCNSKYTFAYSMNGESSRGSTQKFTLGIFVASPNQFNAFNWSGLSGTSVGETLRSNDMLSVPSNVRSKIDYADFRYNI